ncbi:MAG TPA: dockerin type I repeat-containing protein [Planctomycetota bacterium]|jgi:hypothetical protein|nr:dockerin type I repeat-containing protein [Planctomycetota bacterium]OQC22386.1 MAG: hypothetical protein BWX69_00238 [Planctomycetes bacterium ADurb.Bin069]HNR98849.1 dockerin type I repeat-containing protein [Planctomycetota bacterium]HNU26666.1 dockerin type I repeat-containing protein [Planctomycetota bacterium]HOE29165.1 dockerin type I repeat-containing protein [Planctomycetota bacterium]
MVRLRRWIGFTFSACAAALLAAASNADFAIRATGGGSLCSGDQTFVDISVDMNRTGANATPIRGFALAACNVAYQLRITSAVLGRGLTPPAGIKVDFAKIVEQPRGVMLTVIVDYTEDRGIPPTNDFHVLRMGYTVLDAADSARVWPCDRELGSPPLILMFSTGTESFYPPAENLAAAVITSPCVPAQRTFRIAAAADPLKIDADLGTGSTIVEVALREDPVACCPPRLVQGLALTVAVPEDLRIVRFLPGDVYTLGFLAREGPGCSELVLLFGAGRRFADFQTVLRVEVGARPEVWRDVLTPAVRRVSFPGFCVNAATVRYLDGTQTAIADLDGAALDLPVQPRRPFFLRGDVNADGIKNIADAIRLLSWLYDARTAIPPCLDAADANDDGRVDIADVVTILSRTFGGGGLFPEPSRQCGRDPTNDALDCRDFPPCP